MSINLSYILYSNNKTVNLMTIKSQKMSLIESQWDTQNIFMMLRTVLMSTMTDHLTPIKFGLAHKLLCMYILQVFVPFFRQFYIQIGITVIGEQAVYMWCRLKVEEVSLLKFVCITNIWWNSEIKETEANKKWGENRFIFDSWSLYFWN